MLSSGPDWWRTAVFYQVCPRTFQDSDGDGIGDLPGIIRRLDHVRSLGVDALWVCPFYPSGGADFGYDVTDYLGVDPELGMNADPDRLITACHERGIRVVFDLVLNHTSSAHPWFLEGRSSRSAGRRDWYIWRDPAPGGGPPNNWQSAFGGPAWTFEPATGQYYLHSFFAEQPDLNWRNPAVVDAMSEVMRSWLRRGVDGFRLDAVARLAKHADELDNIPNSRFGDGASGGRFLTRYDYLQPELPAILAGLRAVVDEFPGRVLIGETYAPAAAIAPLYGSATAPGLHLVFDFTLIRPDEGAPFVPWDADALAAALRASGEALGDDRLACIQVGNHDVPRFVSRHGRDGRGGARARAAALLLLGLRGVPCIYAGDELGLADIEVADGGGHDPAGRDPARAPMPWDDSPGRGFSEGAPWLPLPPGEMSVAVQEADPSSLLYLYRCATDIRRCETALREGWLRDVESREGVLSFRRRGKTGRGVTVAVNTALAPRRLDVGGAAHVVLATDPGVIVEGGAVVLPPLAAAWLAGGATD